MTSHDIDATVFFVCVFFAVRTAQSFSKLEKIQGCQDIRECATKRSTHVFSAEDMSADVFEATKALGAQSEPHQLNWPKSAYWHILTWLQ